MMYKTIFLRYILFVFAFFTAQHIYSQTTERDIYEIKIYHLDNEEDEQRVDKFLQQAYLPALERAGIEKVGVFKPVEEDSTSGKIYVIIPYTSAGQYFKVPQILNNDSKYLMDGREYLEAPHNNPPYSRIETILMQAFEGMPNYKLTDLSNLPSERVYELRSYESATENLFRNKVKMFNEGEIEIFERLEFNPVFFGEVIAGSKMPNLMYMTAFPNMESRNEHWKIFGDDPAWKEMSVLEEYQDNVSHIDTYLLHPTTYSKI